MATFFFFLVESLMGTVSFSWAGSLTVIFSFLVENWTETFSFFYVEISMVISYCHEWIDFGFFFF